MVKTKDGNTPSMEEILQTIRGVISGDGADEENADDGVLELTDVIEEDGSVTSIKASANENNQPKSTANESKASVDILANIDNAIKKSSPEASPQISNQETEADEIVGDTTTSSFTEETVESLVVDPALDNSSDQEEFIADPEHSLLEPEEITSASSQNSKTIGPDDDGILEISTTEGESPKKRNHRLISEATAKASTKALETLVHKVPKPHLDGPAFRSGITLEELVIEAMTPELSAWLDKNLATLVSHLVEKEIKKLLPQPEDD